MKKTILILLPVAVAGLAWFLAKAFAGSVEVPKGIPIGNIEIRFYGIILAASALIGYMVCRKYSQSFGLTPKSFDDLAFFTIIFGFLGARLYTVAFDFGYYRLNPQEIFKVWHGGLSIFGALLGGLLYLRIWAGKDNQLFKKIIDLACLGIPLAQAFGRFGNFFNHEAFGLPTNLPWKMFVPLNDRPLQFQGFEFFHPTFLYESLLLLLVFFLLLWVKNKVKPGVLAFLYLGGYSLIRFFIEPLRLDSIFIGGYKADQVVAIAVLLISGIMIIRWQLIGEPLASPSEVEKTG
ncbi:MAG: prolipoprotein diacylglyceryl transferase [Acidobacteriaceae bacterium]